MNESDSSCTVVEEIAIERSGQVARGWTHEHDDQHSFVEWEWLIRSRLVAASDPWDSPSPLERRRLLVEVAALAVAAIEAMDRVDGRVLRGLTAKDADRDLGQ